MIYHKYIEIDNLEKVQENSLAYVLSLGKLSTGLSILNWADYTKQCPEVLTSLARYKIRPTLAAIYVSYSHDASYVHRDYQSKTKNQCRINIPLMNCEGSKTEFYSGGTYSAIVQPNGLTYYILEDDSATKVTEVEIIKPTVIRIQEPHRVVTNPERNPRICLSLHTNIDPVFLLT